MLDILGEMRTMWPLTKKNPWLLMSRTQIHVIYGGDALQDGSMDVYELAPALLAIGDVFQEANRVVNGEDVKCTVKVKDSFERGSFDIAFELYSIAQDTYGFLQGRPKSIDDIAFLLGLSSDINVLSGAIGLIRFLKILKGQKITESVSENSINTINIKIHNEGGNINNLNITSEVNNLRKNSRIRKALDEVVKPIEKDGIDTISFKKDGQVIDSIDRSERNYFLPGVEEFAEDIDGTITEIIEETIEIISPNFEGNNKWKVDNGNEKYWAKLADEDFRENMESRRIGFYKGDMYKVRVQRTKQKTSRGLKLLDNTIVNVLENMNSPKLKLD